ncbi:hypothetical protein BDP55DRAFT_638561 [Colletotrichum godetiae]|uniref:Uncharacterized protein n=1 Tax=Colletotrichum godetiae TaxID=1209918 RepID=A0AAJ0A6Z0_9PEZI|nr:uncharacterized protein BDP55DRAFT_638561 [Colletotrichum godetiae]KAK1657666.1 hypothetical protein BDP55DRAFT_638561 [Colletotrichum godetiae]
MHKHVAPIASFLEDFKQNKVTRRDIIRRLSQNIDLVDSVPLSKATAPTQSRYTVARRHLQDIKDDLGQPLYYLCIIASSVTALHQYSRSGFQGALEAWAKEADIPLNFLGSARQAVEEYVANYTPSTIAPHPKRPRETSEGRQQSSNEADQGTRKKSRFDEEEKSLERQEESPSPQYIAQQNHDTSGNYEHYFTTAQNDAPQYLSNQPQGSTTTIPTELPPNPIIGNVIESEAYHATATEDENVGDEDVIPSHILNDYRPYVVVQADGIPSDCSSPSSL